jgi:glycosyltransferase involved in cell wall biosynthesis
MSTLSLCLIVRNEETRLADCLESAREAVDEMIVVDTGSTDRTIEMARSLGARVLSFPWCDDFSAARNFALDQASGDWILHLDADEELDEEDIPQIRQLIDRSDLDSIVVAIHNVEQRPGGRRKVFIHPYPRIFRRHPDIRYQGLVHEFLTHLKATFYTSIRIYHYGYDCPPAEQQERRQRLEKLCLRQLERDPNHPVAHFSLAGVYLGNQRIDEARQHLEKAIDLIDPKNSQYQHFYLMALHYLGGIYATKGDGDRAMEYCLKAIQIRPDYLDPYFLLGELQFRQGRMEEAERTFQGFLDLREQLLQQPVRALFSNARLHAHDHVHLRLGHLCQARGDITRAEQHYHQAVEANPQSVEANIQLARLYTLKLDVGRAKQFLTAARNLQQAALEGN